MHEAWYTLLGTGLLLPRVLYSVLYCKLRHLMGLGQLCHLLRSVGQLCHPLMSFVRSTVPHARVWVNYHLFGFGGLLVR